MAGRNLPLQIGITGGIGSGKSVVCKLFACLEIPVYDADSRAKWLTTHDSEIRERIIGLLGEDAYHQGLYNRSFVASRVFNHPELLRSLNSIVHPAVSKDTARWVSRHRDYPYVIKEAAIMNRAGEGNSLDYVVVVEAPEWLRVRRVLHRDNRSKEEIKAIIARQIADADRKSLADFTITNDETSALIPQVLSMHQRFMGITATKH